jgi:hypothetical protein
MKATYHHYILNFKHASGTSRGVLTTKETWFIKLENDTKMGIGECGLLKGLSIEDRPDYEEKLKWICDNIHLGLDNLLSELVEMPSVQFGLEQAFKSIDGESPFELFPSEFTKGNKSIPINGLVWMGSENNVKNTIDQIRINSPILKEMEANGEIKIEGSVYDMDNGKVVWLE